VAQARLYGFNLSHPTLMARVMLDLKGIDYRLVETPVGLHNVIIHFYGFRGSTVPALRLANGDRVQTTRAIARKLDQVVPEPRLVGEGAEWAQAEEWADTIFQNIPRRLVRRMAARSYELRRDIARDSPLPLPDLQARLTGPVASLLARVAGADEEHITADLRAFPETMDEVDALLTGGVARTDPPDALALQLILTTKTLWRYPQLRPILEGRPSTKLALAMGVPLPGDVATPMPPEWVAAAGVGV
jgi:glutathione S-transferase